MKQKIINHILDSYFFSWLKSLLKGITFKNYEDASLYEVIGIFWQKINNDEILQRANGVAFNFTLAIFPAILFLFTLIPFIHNFIPEVTNERILEFIGSIMPESMFTVISSTIEDILKNTRGGLLTFGALFSFYLAANGVISLMRAFNSCYKTVEKRGFLITRLISLGLTLMLALVCVFAIILLFVGNFAIDLFLEQGWFDLGNYEYFLWIGVRFMVMFIVFYLAISFLYYFGPAVHYNWRFFSYGSMIATLLGLAASYGFSYYVANFANYNKLYGSIGVLIALMIWEYILTVILLVGYEVNASLHHAHRITKRRNISHTGLHV